MVQLNTDVVVIGSGPAGESAALNASKHGLDVIVVEHDSIGGNCTHKGTIPSKALRSAVSSLLNVSRNPMVKNIDAMHSIDFSDLMKNVNLVIQKQVEMRTRFYARNHIKVIRGEASFIDQHNILVQSAKQNQQINAKHIVIATGSRPYRPEGLNFNHQCVFDSDTILSLAKMPRKLIIYGAGVIGCEYASIFSNMGVKVELVNTRQRLLEFLDDEISDALSYHFMSSGVVVRHCEEFESLEHNENNVVLHLASGKRITADAILWSNGRTGNTDMLALDNAGLSANHRGQLDVNEQYQSSVENIYAAGDVIGWPSLASAAYNQGSASSSQILGKAIFKHVDDVPTGIYTLPEISSIGKTERELTQEKVPYEIGRAFFKDTARGQISGKNVGMLKLLFHIDTYELLGIHCFGSEATEIIHIGQAILKQDGTHNDIRYFVNTTFNYPTMAEAYRIAALNGLNRLGF